MKRGNLYAEQGRIGDEHWSGAFPAFCGIPLRREKKSRVSCLSPCGDAGIERNDHVDADIRI